MTDIELTLHSDDVATLALDHLIDDMVAQMIKSDGGYIIAMKSMCT